MDIDFETVVKVEKQTPTGYIYGKTKVKWNFYVEARSSGIKYMSISVPDQDLHLELTEEVYDEATERDEEVDRSQDFKLTDCEVEGKQFTLIQDIYPTELIIDAKGKVTLTFPEGSPD